MEPESLLPDVAEPDLRVEPVLLLLFFVDLLITLPDAFLLLDFVAALLWAQTALK